MPSNRQSGDEGEREIIELVSCPNCGKRLMLLPTGYPLYDVQCSGCTFRAQVKTVRSQPRNIVFGAGWDIMDKVLKAGFMPPPMFVNFHWNNSNSEKQEVRFYPFVPKSNLKKYTLSPTARRANYRMFVYTGLNDLPYFPVYRK